MLFDVSMPLGDEGEVKLIIDSDKINQTGQPFISLSLSKGDKEITVKHIDMHRLAQFVINTRRLLAMVHEDSMLSDDDDDDDDDD